MELIINEKVKTNKPISCFEVEIEFMEGDADGTEYYRFMFPEYKTHTHLDNSFMVELERFLRCIQALIEKDSHGRGGFTETRDLIDEYSGIKDWFRYCANPHEELEDEDGDLDKEDYYENDPSEIELCTDVNFIYYLPTHDEGWYSSYKGLKIYYYNSEGDKFPVTIKY